jgi:pSer/pThr/pTyr-binding forkhead associated (FHA) protein
MVGDMALSPLGPHTSSPLELKERLEAARAAKPFLVYRDGGGSQRLVDLAGAAERVTIGRRPEMDIPLEWDLEVSRLHATLERIGGNWTVADDRLSRNGSFLNGARLTGRQRLCDGDTLRVGDTVFAFCDPEHGQSTATLASEGVPTVADLSETQRRVLAALCRPFKEGGGFATPATNQQIADELFLSVDAIKTHLRALFRKFGIEDLPQNQKRARLVACALQAGLVPAREP